MNKGYIESVDINSVTDKDISIMYEIERDTWSHFMGEYVKCTNDECELVLSKKDIYKELDKNYNKKTVGELEDDFGINNIKCTCCGSRTDFIRGEELRNIIKSRIFGTKESFINFYKSSVDEILGFSYGFIDSVDNIYNKEFNSHFNQNLLIEMINKFGNQDLLTLSGICLIEREKNINIIYELIKTFYCSIDSRHDNLFGVGEAIKGTPSYKIYNKMLPKSFSNENLIDLCKINKDIDSDILYGDKLVKRVKRICKMNFQEFLTYTKKMNK